MKEITRRQQEVLSFIKGYISRHKYPPTIREISTNFGISVKGAYDHVKALKRKQFIALNTNRSRTIEVLESDEPVADEFVSVPLLGRVAAGRPLFADENHDGEIKLPRELLGNKQYFALQISGDSMEGAGIFSGDIGVFAQQSVCNNGEIVVAMVDEAVTLKRFYKEKNRVRLDAENPAYNSIYTQNVRLLGKLVHLIRSYE
ncbi:MAG: transcriptional repressor LexA [Spirochaetes bacterium]|jgi:repressor LexA|nr:transcriptional repressor LexA [Spirochaetota bacterium]